MPTTLNMVTSMTDTQIAVMQADLDQMWSKLSEGLRQIQRAAFSEEPDPDVAEMCISAVMAELCVRVFREQEEAKI